MIICLLGQFPYQGKFLFTSYGPKWAQNGPKTTLNKSFLIILKDFVVVLCWIWCAINIQIIVCLSGQLPYQEKYCFTGYGPKMGPKWAKIDPNY